MELGNIKMGNGTPLGQKRKGKSSEMPSFEALPIVGPVIQRHASRRKQRKRSLAIPKEVLRTETVMGERVLLLAEKAFVAAADDENVDMVMARQIARERELADVGEAFTVVNLNKVVEEFAIWRSELPRVNPHYAVKCNPDKVLLALLSRLGAHYDCASEAEMDAVLASGLATPENVIFANTCKKARELLAAKRMGVRRMTFDNANELEKIRLHFKSAQLVLRIDVTDVTAKSPLGLKYGCQPGEDAHKLLRLAKDKGLKVVGVSFHVGSGCQNPLIYREAIGAAHNLFKEGNAMGHQMHLLDLGGGFSCEEMNLCYKIFQTIRDVLEEYFPEEGWPSCGDEGAPPLEIIAEPGRFFASTPFSVCVNVFGVQQVPASRLTQREEDADKTGFMYYVDDGVYGSFSVVSNGHYINPPKGRKLFQSEKEHREEEQFPSIVWGPTCDSKDRIEKLCLKGRLCLGDWLFYPNMGAYTRATTTNFNGYSMPEDTYYLLGHQLWRALCDRSARYG